MVTVLSWHAPLGVHSTTIRGHQPPQRAVLGQVDCFVQCEVVVSQPPDMGTPWWSLPVLWSGEPLGSSLHLRHYPYLQCAYGKTP